MVEEIKINQNIEKVEEKEKNLKDKVDETYDFIEKIKSGNVKIKNLKLPRKARVKKRKKKQGWIGIFKIEENGSTSGEKQKVSDSVFKTKDGIYHATNGKEALSFEGKYPFLIQPSWRNTPFCIRKEDELNNVFAQKYIMARMMKDAIKIKQKGGGFSGIIWIVVIGVIGYVGYKLLTGGF